MMKFVFLQLVLLLWGYSEVMGQNTNHFVFDQFKEATILYKNKKANRASLNYNKATEEMVYVSSKGENMALYPIDEIDTIYFDKRKFIPKDGRFYEVLLQEKYNLYASYRCRMSVQAQNIGYGTSSTTAVENVSSINTSGEIYQLKLPDNYKAKPYVLYYIEMNNEWKKITKPKDLAKLFPDLEAEIAAFIKKNRLKNRTEDLIKVVRFISNS